MSPAPTLGPGSGHEDAGVRRSALRLHAPHLISGHPLITFTRGDNNDPFLTIKSSSEQTINNVRREENGVIRGYQVAGRVCRIGRHQLLSRSRDSHYPASAAIRHYAEWVIRKDSLSCQTFYSIDILLLHRTNYMVANRLLVKGIVATPAQRSGQKMPRCPPKLLNLEFEFRFENEKNISSMFSLLVHTYLVLM